MTRQSPTKFATISVVWPHRAATKLRTETVARKHTITETTRSLLMQGKTNEQIWAVLERRFHPDPQTRRNISWHRWKMRKEGLLLAPKPTKH